MTAALRPYAKLVTALALLLAMALAGFGHQSVRSQVSPELAEFLAAGGNISDICAGTSETNPYAKTGCESCRLIGAALVPTPAQAPGPVLHFDRSGATILVEQPWQTSQPPESVRQTRAPPHI